MATAVAEAISRLRLPSSAAEWRERELRLYEEDRGGEALLRQVQHGIENYRCCWLPKDGPHHPACRCAD